MTVDTLPDRELRQHVLAAAIRAADGVLAAHGHDRELSLMVLAMAIEDAMAEDDDEPGTVH